MPGAWCPQCLVPAPPYHARRDGRRLDPEFDPACHVGWHGRSFSWRSSLGWLRCGRPTRHWAKATDGLIPFTDVQLPVRPDDSALPHVIDIFAALFRPVSRAHNADILGWLPLLKNAAITWHRAAVRIPHGGTLAGFALGALFARSRLLARG